MNHNLILRLTPEKLNRERDAPTTYLRLGDAPHSACLASLQDALAPKILTTYLGLL